MSKPQLHKLAYLISFLIILTLPSISFGRQKLWDYAGIGGKVAVTNGINSTTKLLQTYPSATVTVYDSGTLTLSSIYSNSIGSVKSNPFTAGSDSYWEFYADNGVYDVRFSGGGITTPFTLQYTASDHEEVYNVKGFGAKCDWNGTTGTDDTSAILATRTAAGIGGRVYFPRGLCLVSARIPMLSGQTFEGVSSSVTGISGMIQSAGTGTIFIGGGLRELVIQNLYLGTTSLTQLSNSIGIEMSSDYPNTTFHVTIRNVFTENFNMGGLIEDHDPLDGTPDWQIENVSVEHWDIGECNYGLKVDSRNADLLNVKNSHYSVIVAGFYGNRTGNTILENVTAVNATIGYRFTGLSDSTTLIGLSPENNTDDLIIDTPGNYLPAFTLIGNTLYKVKVKENFIIHSESNVYQEFKADYTNDLFISSSQDRFIDGGLSICAPPTCFFTITGNSKITFSTSKYETLLSSPTNLLPDGSGNAKFAVGRRTAGTGYTLSGNSSLIETYASGDKNVLNLFTRESPSSFTAAKWAIGIGSDGSFIFQDQTGTAVTPLTISPSQLSTFSGNVNITPLTGNPLLGVGTSSVGSGGSNVGAAVDIKSVGDKLPYLLLDGAGRSGFTNRKWGWIVGSTGQLEAYDVTGTNIRTKIDTSGNFQIGIAGIVGAFGIPTSGVTWDIRGTGTHLGIYNVAGSVGFTIGRDNTSGKLIVDGNQANIRTVQLKVPLQLTSPVDSKPACDVGNRFKVWTTAGGAGVVDSVEICTKDVADVYAWRSML